MADNKSIFSEDENSSDDALQEKIKQYREMLKKQKPDLDIELLFRIMRIMNESSEVKIALDPISEDGSWESKATTYAVAGVTQLDDGRYALRTNRENHGITIAKLERELGKAFKHDRGSGKPVLFVHGDEVTQLTDAYSHALTREQWAGMPFDLVLAVKSERKQASEDGAKA